MRAEDWAARASFHRRFRYVGMALFLVAAAVELGVVVAVGSGLLPARNLLLGVFALGVSLGSFGASNDTALHAMLQLLTPAPALAQELAVERSRRPARLAVVHASPKMAFILPLVALSVELLLIVRLDTVFR